jgi:hypothetical protein
MAKKATTKDDASTTPDEVDLSQFPLTDEKNGLRIDVSFQEPRKFSVYYWCERPDAEERVEGDKEHWHPDSVHDTLEAAQERLKALTGGAKLKSIYRYPEGAGPTKH